MSILLLTLSALAQTPKPALGDWPAIRSWKCRVHEGVDDHTGAVIQMPVELDGTRGALSFYVTWVGPTYTAEQRMCWIGIPKDADKLWKPDEIEISIKGERTDEEGRVIFHSAKYGQVERPARGLAKSARPTLIATRVNVDEAYLRAQLWSAWPWAAEHVDREAAPLGRQAILLPNPDSIQAIFKRLRAKLESAAADPAMKCFPVIPIP